jgi:hypothetical protein
VFRNNMAGELGFFSPVLRFCVLTYVLLHDGSPPVYAPSMPQRYPAWFVSDGVFGPQPLGC